MSLGLFFIIFAVQIIFAVVVVFVLKRVLDRELVEVALEKLENTKSPEDLKDIVIRYGTSLNEQAKSRLESVRKRKFSDKHLILEEDSALQGGVVIVVGNQTLDFSLSSRLRNFWS